MGRTLFFYVFRDLVKVFVLTNLVLAGIMSFGVLIKPLTQSGLDASQVGRMLAFAMPAMFTYSLPVAALFACTFVYGKLASDNELVATRAAGLSLTRVAVPGVVLGAVVSVISLASLLYVVPAATFAGERVIYSNLARLVAFQIRRDNQLELEAGPQKLTIYASDADVMLSDAGDGPDAPQIVSFYEIAAVRYAPRPEMVDPGEWVRVPDQHFLANKATLYITGSGDPDQDVQVTATFENGTMLPRTQVGEAGGEGERGGRQAAFAATQYGPYPFPSPLDENPKFMSLTKLRELTEHPERSREVGATLRLFVRGDQQDRFLKHIMATLQEQGSITFTAGDETYVLSYPQSPERVRQRKQRLLIGPEPGDVPAVGYRHLRGGRAGGEAVLSASAEHAVIEASMLPDGRRASVELFLYEPRLQVNERDEAGRPRIVETRRPAYRATFVVEAPEAVRAMESATVEEYYQRGSSTPNMRRTLRRELIELNNAIRGEFNARLSFAFSCIALCTVGTAMGMLFRTGNVLTAFSLSVVPALAGIILVITGQHVAENVPKVIDEDFVNPLMTGLTLIWGGNLGVFLLGVLAMFKLRRA